MTAGPIRCFLLTPTADRYRVSLRRFGATCTGPMGYHDARELLGEEHHATAPTSGDVGVPHDDPRWPRACASCGAPFGADDAWQVNYDLVHTRSDGGPDTTTSDAPVGAMWFRDIEGCWAGPDGRTLIVRTPGGDWMPDAPSRQGTPWTRSGTAPVITASPSILFPGGYHAWLRDGVLVPC